MFMSEVGKIKNVTGCMNAKSISVGLEDNEYYILAANGDGRVISEYLASVSISHDVTTSKKGVVAKTVLGGLAGSTYARGNMGLTGAIVGLGSSINTETQSLYITLKFINGDILHGQTDGKTALLLESLSSQYSDEDCAQIQEEEAKYSRLLDDAPRAYYEVQQELEELSLELKKLDDAIENGDNFDIRDEAKQKHSQLENLIDEKNEILEELEFRAKGAKKYGTFDEFNELQAPYSLKIEALENKLKRNWLIKKWHVVTLVILTWLYFPNSDDEFMRAIYYNALLLFIVYYIGHFLFRLIRNPTRRKKLNKLQKEYDEKYSLKEIIL